MISWAWKVYKVVMSIPFGQVRAYKWVAAMAGKPKAARAVGQILKRNPYLLIIPCHRIVKGNNKLGGYALGLKYKKMLLDSERKIVECLGNRR